MIKSRRKVLFLLSRARFLDTGHRAGYSSSQETDHTSYCMSLVNKSDYESYLCTLLLPKESRASAFAIRAFNVEVSQIQDIVSDPNIGRMRVQFWRDSINRILEGNPPESPIAMELARAHQKHKFTKRWFTNLLDARESRLSGQSYTSLAEVEQYSDRTFTSVLMLTLECLGIRDLQADHAASHAGKAQGITTVVRAVPYHASRGKVLLPQDLLIQHNVSQEEVLRSCDSQKVKDIIYELASEAKVHLQVAREMRKSLPPKTNLALLPCVPCDAYLELLLNVDFNVTDPSLLRRNSWLPIMLLKSKWKKSF